MTDAVLNKQYNLIIDGPGLRNAFEAGVLYAFQEFKIKKPNHIIAYSGAVPLAVAYLLDMDMKEEIFKWSQKSFPQGLLTPEKTRNIYHSFCIQIGKKFSEEAIKKKLSCLKILCSRRNSLKPKIYEKMDGDLRQLEKIMIHSGGIPFITQNIREKFIDGGLSLWYHQIHPKDFLKKEEFSFRISVGKRSDSNIFYKKKLPLKSAIFYDPIIAERLFRSGYRMGLKHLREGTI